MRPQNSRKYVSPVRERQAMDTRNRVIDMVQVLLHEKGFVGMTVADVARRAGVSTQTVYAIFTSKAGIIMAVIEDRVLSNARNVDILKQVHATDDVESALRSIAKLMRNIHADNILAFAALYGAAMVSPQLAELEKELDALRLAKLNPIAFNLVASGRLLPHLDEETARDILWLLTGREQYHLLVVRRGWSMDKYEQHLASLLISSLLRQ